MQIVNCKMKIENLKSKIYNLQFSIVILTVFFLQITAECMAGEVSFNAPFGINHPNKKVSAPAIAVHEDKVYISYVREEGDVYLTILSADGKTVLQPVQMNDKTFPANGIHQSPGLAVGAKGEIYVTVTWTSPRQIQSGASPRDGDEFAADIRFAKSVDGGKTFLPSVIVNDNPMPGSRGFESIAVGKDGAIYVAWLDGREKKSGVSSVYFAKSTDSGRTFEKNIKLDDNACPCCRTAVASGPNGAVYVSWRKVFEGDMRDMVVAGSSDSGKMFQQPVLVSRDQWQIQGCPHRGPSMAVDENGILYYTWYTEGNDALPAVYLAMSKDNGKTFTARQSMPVSNHVFPDHPKLAVGKNGTAYLVWEEKTPVLSKIMFASYQDSKGFSKPEQLSQGVRRSYEPMLLAGDNGVVYAVWAYDEIRFSKAVIRAMKP